MVHLTWYLWKFGACKDRYVGGNNYATGFLELYSSREKNASVGRVRVDGRGRWGVWVGVRGRRGEGKYYR